MKIYRFTRRQLLPITVEKAWDFLSDPRNLKLTVMLNPYFCEIIINDPLKFNDAKIQTLFIHKIRRENIFDNLN